MKRWITRDDFKDLFVKIRQRGGKFLLSKVHPNPIKRTQSAFDESAINSANWWIVPAVRKRWNKLISGQEDLNYKQKLMLGHLAKKENQRLLSLGSGSCSHELELATYPQFQSILCMDIAQNRLDRAAALAVEGKLDNISFQCRDIHRTDLGEKVWDIILFNMSLHHFYQVRGLLENKIKPALKPGGLLIINEYIGPDRLQYPPHQIKVINQALKTIPDKFRVRFRTPWKKNQYYGSGYLRMVIADPSECVNSSDILPTVRSLFKVIEEKPYGGNILMPVLKDIAHHFQENNEQTSEILQKLFHFEDEYLKENPSDFMFGIYKKV